MKSNKIMGLICITGMFACWFMIGMEYSSTSVYYLNTTTEYCNLSDLNTITNDNLVSIDNKFNRVRNEVADIHNLIEEIEVKTIQFYPRTQRKCKNPITINLHGISMQPFLYDGDVIYADKVKFKDIELGDVISFNRNNSETGTIHAVVGIYEDYLVTAGYNNPRKDKLVYPEEIKYRFCEKAI